MTESAFERRARPMITGRVPQKSEPWVNDTREALRLTPAQSASLARFGRALKRAGVGQTSIDVRLRRVSQHWNGDVLVVEANKHVRLPFEAARGKKPVVEQHVSDVTLRYRIEGGRWIAVSAETDLPLTAPREPLEDPTFRFPVPSS